MCGVFLCFLFFVSSLLLLLHLRFFFPVFFLFSLHVCAAKYLDQANKEEGRCLVYCADCVCSVVVVCAYLIHCHGASVDSALMHCLWAFQKCADPEELPPPYLAALREFEKKHSGGPPKGRSDKNKGKKGVEDDPLRTLSPATLAANLRA